MPTWINIAALVALTGALVYLFWRQKKIMTLEESLQNLVKFNQDSIIELQKAVSAIPQRIKDVLDDYRAKNPDKGGTVPDEVLIEAMREITDQSKTMLSNAVVIGAMFDSQIAHGNPEWPNDPTTV